MNNQETKGRPGQNDLRRWAEQTDDGRHVLIWKFFMGGRELPGWTLIKSISEELENGNSLQTYIWRASKSDGRLLKVDVIEHDSWGSAQENLIDFFNHFQSPHIPEADSAKVNAGDVAFTGPGETVHSTVFTRANILARMQSVGEEDIPVTEQAVQLDRLLVSRPELAKEGVAPVIEEFSAGSERAKPGEPITLTLQASDPLEGFLWYKFVADRGEFEVEGESVRYLPSEEGEHNVTVFAITETGFAGAGSVIIRVE